MRTFRHNSEGTMTKEKQMAKAFGLDEENWRRHSNPWSVWTRNLSLPFLIIAFWSRIWIGWYCLIPISLAIFWTWINPRLFKAPRSTKNWASRAVLGERVWLNRKEINIPAIHQLMPNILSAVAGIGALFVILGVYKTDIWITLFGSALVYAGKLWFLDRMVWLYLDMKDKNEEFSSWTY